MFLGGGTWVGLALAQDLLDDDDTLVLMDRRTAVLKNGAKRLDAPQRVFTQAADLSDPIALARPLPTVIMCPNGATRRLWASWLNLTQRLGQSTQAYSADAPISCNKSS